MKTLKKLRLTTIQKKALTNIWNDILSGKERYNRLLEVLEEKVQKEEVRRFIQDSARIRDLIQKDTSLQYHSLEAYCHDVTVAIKSFLHVDAVTLNIYRVRDSEYEELIPYGWSASETTTFINKRIRIKRGSNPNLAGKLSDSTKPINIPDYAKVKEDRFGFKDEALSAGFKSGCFIPLRTTNKFVGNIALHLKKVDWASGDFFEYFLEALIDRLSSNLKEETHWDKDYKFLLSHFCCYQRMRESVLTIRSFPLKGVIPIFIIMYCMFLLYACYNVPIWIILYFYIIILSFIASVRVILWESKEFEKRFREDVYCSCKNRLKEKGPIISDVDFLDAGNKVRHDLSKSVRKEIVFVGIISLVVLAIMILSFWLQYKVILAHDEACITKEHQIAGSNEEDKILKKCSSFDAMLLAISRISNAGSWNVFPTKPLSKCLLSVQSFLGYLWLLCITSFLITIVVYKSNYWKQLMDGELNQIERHLKDTNYMNWWWPPHEKKVD